MLLIFTDLQFNLLRRYREQVSILQAELQKSQAQAADAKSKYAEWNNDLKANKEQLREDKKSWMKEAANLRGKEKESQVCRTINPATLDLDTATRLYSPLKVNFWLMRQRRSFNFKLSGNQFNTKLIA